MRMSASALPNVSPTGVASLRKSFTLKHSLLIGTSLAAFAWSAAPALAQSQETVIVTGTRVQGMTAADSAEPVTVVDTAALTQGIGSTDLRQALGQIVPSFSAQQYANDTAEFSLSAALRGLSPNDTLVLVNGHRRHYTANLHVDGGNFASGSSSPDISLIPEAAIDHVEVLLDGAAAQYGTDAIAGVVNIITKKILHRRHSSGHRRPILPRRRRHLRSVRQYRPAAAGQGLCQHLRPASRRTDYTHLGGRRLRATSMPRASPRPPARSVPCPMPRASFPAPAASAFPPPGPMR